MLFLIDFINQCTLEIKNGNYLEFLAKFDSGKTELAQIIQPTYEVEESNGCEFRPKDRNSKKKRKKVEKF